MRRVQLEDVGAQLWALLYSLSYGCWMVPRHRHSRSSASTQVGIDVAAHAEVWPNRKAFDIANPSG